MTVSIVDSWQGFAALRSDWDRLLAACGARSIYASWQWMDAWRLAVAEKITPYILVARDAEQVPQAILPLWYSRSSFAGGLVRYRTLRFLGDTATGAEYPVIIAGDAIAVSAGQLMVAYLEAHSDEWDLVFLPRIAGWNGAMDHFRDALGQSSLEWSERERRFSHFQLPASLAEYEARFSARHRQTMRRTSRKVISTEGVLLGSAVDGENLEGLLDALFDLHRRHWSSQGDPGSFSRQPAMVDFYRHFVPVAMAQGWLGFYYLKHHGEFKAVQIGYIFDGDYQQLQEGYDPEFLAGTGNALRHQMIGDLIELGVQGYDFLGGVSEHKRRWGAEVRMGHDLLMIAPGLRQLPLRLRETWPGSRLLADDADEVIREIVRQP